MSGINPSAYEYGSAEFFVASALLARVQGAIIDPVAAAAQAILESGWGKSELAQNTNNFLGIKASSPCDGPTYNKETSEFTQAGEHYRTDAVWRVYDSPEGSFKDYGEFIAKPRYQAARIAVTRRQGHHAYVKAIKDAGYATDPNYVDKVINIIGREKLSSIAVDMLIEALAG